ncbi:MAG TPA: methyltransferase domain-containing protein [Allosphingosinicella sp.]|nr:methyltransferase domain-containing protein [Allosphingosinicella sp.]
MQLRSTPEPEIPLVGYEDVAGHYYDAVLHPTCAAFREGSIRLLGALLPPTLTANLVVEVGAGRASVPVLFPDWTSRISELVLLDSSPTMLSYSREYAHQGATLALASAQATGLASGSVDVLIASLGDPFNDRDFWVEVKRVLSSFGIAFFTTPSPQWASRFRQEGQITPEDSAEFINPGGEAVCVPSSVLPIDDQSALLRTCGLIVEAIANCYLADAPQARRAPKLQCVADEDPFVIGYSIRHAE